MTNSKSRMQALGRQALPLPNDANVSVPLRVFASEHHKPASCIKSVVQKHFGCEGVIAVDHSILPLDESASKSDKELELSKFLAKEKHRAAARAKKIRLDKLKEPTKDIEVRSRVQTAKDYSNLVAAKNLNSTAAAHAGIPFESPRDTPRVHGGKATGSPPHPPFSPVEVPADLSATLSSWAQPRGSETPTASTGPRRSPGPFRAQARGVATPTTRQRGDAAPAANPGPDQSHGLAAPSLTPLFPAGGCREAEVDEDAEQWGQSVLGPRQVVELLPGSETSSRSRSSRQGSPGCLTASSSYASRNSLADKSGLDGAWRGVGGTGRPEGGAGSSGEEEAWPSGRTAGPGGDLADCWAAGRREGSPVQQPAVWGGPWRHGGPRGPGLVGGAVRVLTRQMVALCSQPQEIGGVGGQQEGSVNLGSQQLNNGVISGEHHENGVFSSQQERDSIHTHVPKAAPSLVRPPGSCVEGTSQSQQSNSGQMSEQYCPGLMSKQYNPGQMSEQYHPGSTSEQYAPGNMSAGMQARLRMRAHQVGGQPSVSLQKQKQWDGGQTSSTASPVAARTAGPAIVASGTAPHFALGARSSGDGAAVTEQLWGRGEGKGGGQGSPEAAGGWPAEAEASVEVRVVRRYRPAAGAAESKPAAPPGVVTSGLGRPHGGRLMYRGQLLPIRASAMDPEGLQRIATKVQNMGLAIPPLCSCNMADVFDASYVWRCGRNCQLYGQPRLYEQLLNSLLDSHGIL